MSFSFFFRRCVAVLMSSVLVFQAVSEPVLAAANRSTNDNKQLEELSRMETDVSRLFDRADTLQRSIIEKNQRSAKKREIETYLSQEKQYLQEEKNTAKKVKRIEEIKKRVMLKSYAGLTPEQNLRVSIAKQVKRSQREHGMEALRSAIKQDGKTTLLLTSTVATKHILKTLLPFDPSVRVELVYKRDSGENVYKVTMHTDAMLAQELLGSLDEGVIPTSLLEYEIVQPDVFSIDAAATLQGEDVSQLRGIQHYEARAYQYAVHEREKVIVGVVDTGIDGTHPDLREALSTEIPGYDFVNRDADASDDHYHGTHVAGTIGALINGQGIFGVNSNVDLVPLKICDKNGMCPSYAMYDALMYAAEQGIQVLNMSLGGKGTVEGNALCDAIRYATQQGVIVVAAAGNGNDLASTYLPGGCPEVITVGAVDAHGKRASFSNYGSRVDVSAPGVGIVSTVPNGEYRALDGTSMAAPHIAGLVSFIEAVSPNQSVSQIKTLLQQTVHPVVTEEGKQMGGSVVFSGVMEQLGIQAIEDELCEGGVEWEGGVCGGDEEIVIIEEDMLGTGAEWIEIGTVDHPAALSVTPGFIELEAGIQTTLTIVGGSDNLTVHTQSPYIGLGKVPGSTLRIADVNGGSLSFSGSIPEEGFVSDKLIEERVEDAHGMYPNQTIEMLSLEGDTMDMSVQSTDPNRNFVVRGNRPGIYSFQVLDDQGNNQRVQLDIKERIMYVKKDSTYYFRHTPQYEVKSVSVPTNLMVQMKCSSASCGKGIDGGYNYGFKTYNTDGVAHISVNIYNRNYKYNQSIAVTVVIGNTYYEHSEMDKTLPPPNRGTGLRTSERSDFVNFREGEVRRIYLGGGTPPYGVSFNCNSLIAGSMGSYAVMNGQGGGGGVVIEDKSVPLNDEQERRILERMGLDRATLDVSQVETVESESSNLSNEDIGVAGIVTGNRYYVDVMVTYVDPCIFRISDSAGGYKKVTYRSNKEKRQFVKNQNIVIQSPVGFPGFTSVTSYNTSVLQVEGLPDGRILLKPVGVGEAYVKVKFGTKIAYVTIQVAATGDVRDVHLFSQKIIAEPVPALTVSHSKVIVKAGEVASVQFAGGVAPYRIARSSTHIGLVEDTAVVLSAQNNPTVAALSDFENRSESNISFLGLKPGVSTLTITDQVGTQTSVTVEVQTEVLTLGAGTGYYLNAPPLYTIEDVHVVTGTSVAIEYIPTMSLYQLLPIASGNALIEIELFNPFEGATQTLQYTVRVEGDESEFSLPEPNLPPLSLSHQSLSLRVGEIITLRVSGGTPMYIVSASGDNKTSIGFSRVVGMTEDDIGLSDSDYGVIFLADTGSDMTDVIDESGLGMVVDTAALIESGVATGVFDLYFESTGSVDLASGTVQSSSRYFRVMAMQQGSTQIAITDTFGRKGYINVQVTDRALKMTIGEYQRLERTDRYRIERVQTSNATLLPVAYLGGGTFEVRPTIHGSATLRVTIYNEHQEKQQRLTYPISIVNSAGQESLQPVPTPQPSPGNESDELTLSLNDDQIAVGDVITLMISKGQPGSGGYEIILEEDAEDILIPIDDEFVVIEDADPTRVVTVYYGTGDTDPYTMYLAPVSGSTVQSLFAGVISFLAARDGTASIKARDGIQEKRIDVTIAQGSATVPKDTALSFTFPTGLNIQTVVSSNPSVIDILSGLTPHSYLFLARQEGSATITIPVVHSKTQAVKAVIFHVTVTSPLITNVQRTQEVEYGYLGGISFEVQGQVQAAGVDIHYPGGVIRSLQTSDIQSAYGAVVIPKCSSDCTFYVQPYVITAGGTKYSYGAAGLPVNYAYGNGVLQPHGYDEDVTYFLSGLYSEHITYADNIGLANAALIPLMGAGLLEWLGIGAGITAAGAVASSALAGVGIAVGVATLEAQCEVSDSIIDLLDIYREGFECVIDDDASQDYQCLTTAAIDGAFIARQQIECLTPGGIGNMDETLALNFNNKTTASQTVNESYGRRFMNFFKGRPSLEQLKVDIPWWNSKFTAEGKYIRDNDPSIKMLTPEATELASKLGYQKVSGITSGPHGAAVYFNSKAPSKLKYISPDTTGHIGGVWKTANTSTNLNSDVTRSGTYNADLNRRMGK